MLFNFIVSTKRKAGVSEMEKNAKKNNNSDMNLACSKELDSLINNTRDIVIQGWKDLKANESAVFDTRLTIAWQLKRIKDLPKGKETELIRMSHAFGATSLIKLNPHALKNYEKNFKGVSYNFLNACFKLSKYVDSATGKLDENAIIDANLSSNTITNMTGSRHMGINLGIEPVTKKEAEKIKGEPKTRTKEKINPSDVLLSHIDLVKSILNRTEPLTGSLTKEQSMNVKQAIVYIHQVVSKHKDSTTLEHFLLQDVDVIKLDNNKK
tara:strand:- start:327 stop:1127 length:801 start_codon:yes stop_codon:yes gene_type:complete